MLMERRKDGSSGVVYVELSNVLSDVRICRMLLICAREVRYWTL
jgi:hypothetical protein